MKFSNGRGEDRIHGSASGEDDGSDNLLLFNFREAAGLDANGESEPEADDEFDRPRLTLVLPDEEADARAADGEAGQVDAAYVGAAHDDAADAVSADVVGDADEDRSAGDTGSGVIEWSGGDRSAWRCAPPDAECGVETTAVAVGDIEAASAEVDAADTTPTEMTPVETTPVADAPQRVEDGRSVQAGLARTSGGARSGRADESDFRWNVMWMTAAATAACGVLAIVLIRSVFA
jgi:hypothetical protein